MKTYIKPQTETLVLNTENVIAMSMPIGDTPGDQMLSRELGGWNSENWSEIEDEEEDY